MTGSSKMTFKQRQIKTWEISNKLHEVTQKLMFDLLSSLSKEELAMISDFHITDYETIVSVEVEHESFTVEVDGENFHESKAFDDCSQLEQKELIDFIMYNILKQ